MRKLVLFGVGGLCLAAAAAAAGCSSDKKAAIPTDKKSLPQAPTAATGGTPAEGSANVGGSKSKGQTAD